MNTSDSLIWSMTTLLEKLAAQLNSVRAKAVICASTAVTPVLTDDACLIAIVRSDSRQVLRVVNGIARNYRLEPCFPGALTGVQCFHLAS